MDFTINDELKNEAQKYEHISTELLVDAFKENHIYLPDFVYRFLLLNTFKKYVFNEENMKKYTDEFYYKLRSYDFFSVYLLKKTVEIHEISVPVSDFKNMFIRFFLKNEKKFKGTVIVLHETLDKAESQDDSNENILDCLKKFDELFYTPKGYLDGLPLSILKESLCETYNAPYLRELASKYGVEVPKRLNKTQLVDLVATRFNLEQDERALLEGKAITDIVVYSKRKGFRVSSDLKKSDIVEYIIYSLNKYNEEVEKDLYNYDVLVETDLTNSNLEQVKIESTDQAIPISSNMVDPENATNEPEQVIQNAVKEENKEPEVVEETKEPEVEEIKEETKEPEVVEETKEPETEEIKEETKEEEKDENLSDSDLYYDQSVDDEIISIIKKYYSKKSKKDSGMRWVFVTLFVIALVGLLYFALKFYNVF